MKTLGIFLGLILIFSISTNNAFSETKNCLVKDERNGLDRFMSDHRNYIYTQLPLDVQDPIYNKYKEIMKLPKCKDNTFLSWKNTYTGSMVKDKKGIEKLDKIWKTGGFGSAEFRDYLFKNYVLPFPDHLKFQGNPNPSGTITGKVPFVQEYPIKVSEKSKPKKTKSKGTESEIDALKKEVEELKKMLKESKKSSKTK